MSKWLLNYAKVQRDVESQKKAGKEVDKHKKKNDKKLAKESEEEKAKQKIVNERQAKIDAFNKSVNE